MALADPLKARLLRLYVALSERFGPQGWWPGRLAFEIAGWPVFVADASARRVLVRHRLLPNRAGYELARRYIEAHLPSDSALFNEFHALFVATGTTHCRATPKCAGCPLRFDLRGRRPAAWRG